MFNSESVGRHGADTRVSGGLRHAAPQYGYVIAEDVILSSGAISTQIDHAVVDRYGVLLIDAEHFEGASILGADTDKNWVAKYPGGREVEFRNPLHVNAGNEGLLRQTLAVRGIHLEPNEVRSAVVFVGADISRLTLVELSALKVRTLDELDELLDARYSFPPNNGRLGEAEVQRIALALEALSGATQQGPEEDTQWRPDPIISSTTVGMSVPPPPTHAEDAHRAPGQLSGHHMGPTEGPSMRTALLTLGTILLIILTVVAGIVFFPQLQAGSTAAWTAALVLLVALSELVAANLVAARSRGGLSRRGGFAGGAVRFVTRVALVFLFVAGMWILIAGGTADQLGAFLTRRFDPPVLTFRPSNTRKTDPGLFLAQKRLKQNAPQVYKAVIDLEKPTVADAGDGSTSYTWSYLPKGSSEPASYTITIDSAGRAVTP